MLRIALLLAFAVSVVVAINRLDLQVHIETLSAWIDSLGAWAPLAFIVIDAAFVVLLLPGILLTFSAGFLFGVVSGTAYVVIGTTAGAAIAFLVSRWLLGVRARNYVASHPRLGLLASAGAGAGWQFVLLTRVIPFFPFKLSNYVFGLSPFRFGAFVLGTAVGVVPYSFVNVYIGSLAASLSDVQSGMSPETPLQWAVYLLGLAVALAAVTYLSLRARKALQCMGESNSPSQ